MQQMERSKVKSGRNGRIFTTVFTRANTQKFSNNVLPVSEEFEDKLAQLAEVIDGKISVSNGLRDGRLVSMENEYKVSSPLLDNFSWLLGKNENRAKGDVYIETAGGTFPVNIKLIGSNNKSRNNICGMVHNAAQLLYGEKCSSREELARCMRDYDFTTTPQQYGVLTVNKLTCKTDWFTLFNIADLYVNPSNDLQFSLDDIVRIKRTQEEGQKFLYDKLTSLFKKQAKAWTILNGVI